MKCPYCGNEMKTGYVQSARPVFWSPEKKKVMFKPSPDDDFYITEGFWNGCFAESHFCKDCGKVIISAQKP